MNKRAILALTLLLAVVPAFAQDQPPEKPNHGYAGVGLMLASDNFIDGSQSGGSYKMNGAGLIINGAGAFKGQGVGFGLTGEFAFANLSDDNSNTVANSLFGVDFGLLLSDFYFSFGVQATGQTPENSDVTVTYTVLPLGIGLLSADEKGYSLIQLRFGSGELSSNYSSATEDLGYYGIRLEGQSGSLMGGMELDHYSFSSSSSSDQQLRMFIGFGFGS